MINLLLVEQKLTVAPQNDTNPQVLLTTHDFYWAIIFIFLNNKNNIALAR